MNDAITQTVEQGTPEWHALRCGKVTASRIADLTAKTKTGPSASRSAYMGQLIAERLTGCVAESYSSKAMQEGTEREPQARAAYVFICDSPVEQIAFVDHARIPMCGCSPDGLVGSKGLVEVKCPAVHTHLDTLITETIDGKYIKQMNMQMAVTGREWCDFVSFHPELPPRMRLFVKRVPRDSGLIAELEDEVRSFQLEMDLRLSVLKEKFG